MVSLTDTSFCSTKYSSLKSVARPSHNHATDFLILNEQFYICVYWVAPYRSQGRVPIWQNNLEHNFVVFCIGYIFQWGYLKSILSASWIPMWNNIGTRTDYCSHQFKSLPSLTDPQTSRYANFICCLTHPAHFHDLIHKDIMQLYKMLSPNQSFQCLYHSPSKNLFSFKSKGLFCWDRHYHSFLMLPNNA